MVTKTLQELQDKFDGLLATLDPAILPEDEELVSEMYALIDKLKEEIANGTV